MIRRRPQLGMTLIELVLAVAGTAMVGLATTALLAGAASAWDSREQFSDQLQSIRTVSHQLQQMVYGSRRIVSSHVGERYTDLVLWVDDDQFPAEVNLSELAVLTWDSQLKALTLHRTILTDAQKQNLASNPAFVPASVGSSSFGSSFRASASVQTFPLAEQVTGFDLTIGNGSLGVPNYRQLFIKMTTRTAVGGTSQVVTISAAARAPDTAVDFAQGGG